MRPNLISRLKEEWNKLDPVDPLRGLIADAIDALAEPAQEPAAGPHKWGCRANAFGECNMGCTSQPASKPLTDEPMWIVNDLGELGVKVNGRFFFLYKGDSIEYGESDQGNTSLHDDGTPMRYRIVGKREFGETCWPLQWITQGRREDRYTKELEYISGMSFGKPEDAEWKSLPAAHAKENRND